MTITKKNYWQTHIEQWQMSGLSQAAYCRQHDLSENSLSYHKHRLADSLKNTAPANHGFSRVQIMESYMAIEPLSVELNNGLKVTGITHHNLALVKQLTEELS